MVLSGCRICGNLTYEVLNIEGGTRRQCKRTKEQQRMQRPVAAGYINRSVSNRASRQAKIEYRVQISEKYRTI
jgi:hypothetical protein